MKTSRVAVAALIALVVVPQAFAYEPAGASLWTAKVSALILGRSRPHSSPILNIPGNNLLLNAHDFRFDWQAGPDISLIRRLAPDRALELRYFNVAPFQARLSGNRPQQGESSGFNFDSLYQTQLFGSELNLREASSEVEWLTWLAGFRWLQVSETLEIRPGPGSFDSFLKYATSNCLVGGQVGADTRLWSDGGPFSLDGIFKAGVFGNVASNEFTDIKKFAPPVRANDNLGAVSFVGEIGITGVYRWTDHVALRGGYELLWVQGVAVAGDQPDATHIATHNGIDGHSGIFFQGVVIGLEFSR